MPPRTLTMLVASTLVIVGCGLRSDDSSSAQDPTDNTTPGQVISPAPSTIPDRDGEQINRYNVDPGDCFNDYAFIDNGRAVDITTREACSEPHQSEVYHFTQHPAPFGVPFPGEQEMRSFATRICYEAFEPFVGNLYELSVLEIGTIIPNQINFEDERARYRGVHCYIERSDGEELVGSVADSGL